MRRLAQSLALAGTTALLVTAGASIASAQNVYQVTVTNITQNQTFTPILVASHQAGVRLFTVGTAASVELEQLAEDGTVIPLTGALNVPEVLDVNDSGGLLPAGQSVTIEVATQGNFDHISMAAMLIPTNDAFVGLTDLEGPTGNKVLVRRAPAYDACTEANDELCVNIPGPPCFGSGFNAEGGEGLVHIHNGIHGIGVLAEEVFDWGNPVAEISIRVVNADD